MEIITVARDGSRMTGGPVSRPIFCTAIYRAVPRVKDGVITYRRVGSLRDGTSGNGVTGPMIARAKAAAAERGVPFIPNVRYGDRA